MSDDLGYDAWWRTVQQQNAAYDQKIQRDMDQATFQQALASPGQFGGYGPFSNALFGRANNSATQLFQAADPYNPVLAQYMLNSSQPGMSGDTISADPQLLSQLLRTA